MPNFVSLGKQAIHLWQDSGCRPLTTREKLVDTALKTLLDELAAFGDAHDRAAESHAGRMLNITPDTGEFLAVLVKAMRAHRILEVGTSNGYSTIWLADAAGPEGAVTTLELAPGKIAMARANFDRAALAQRITLLEGDAGTALANLFDASCDLVFLDSRRSDYMDWWPHLKRVLRPGGLLVVDNATSHAHEMAEFTEAVRADPHFTTSLVPVGKGEFLAVKT
jgi:predicted O-methyltransferase YrrM